MRRFAALTALLALPGCSGSLDLSYGSGPPTPRIPPDLATPTPTPSVPSVFPDDAGDARDGDLVLAPGEMRKINVCHPVSSTNGDVVTLAATGLGLAAGMRALVWQVQDSFAESGDGAGVTAPGMAGVFEVGRIATIAGTSVMLEVELSNGYETSVDRSAQLCALPEYGSVTVPASSSLVGDPWDGSRGGVIAFFAQGIVNIEGTVDASGIGFRGGVSSSGENGGQDVVLLDTSADSGGGKGEGLDRASFALFGRGNYANGAGGGNSRNAGGGGGGGGGSGGVGGKQSATNGNVEGTKGLGGAAVTPGDLRLTFGGGGGGGHQNDGLSTQGGAGGGLVVIIAGGFSGGPAATINASGAGGLSNGSGTTGDGAGGGGGGGTIVLLTKPMTFGAIGGTAGWEGTIRARGGDGGSCTDLDDLQGTGGGGGGGRVITNDASFTVASLVGGARGVNTQYANDPNGSENGSVGVVTYAD